MYGNISIKILLAVFIAVSLITCFVPNQIILADDTEEEIILEELTGEDVEDSESKIEVLGFTDEEVTFLGDKFFLTVIIIIAAAAVGIILSFVIRSRT
jgi:hypothetical protein